jgi:DNA-binding transcriptional ArsR family regulator
MASFPTDIDDTTNAEREPRVIELEDDDAAALLQSLSSETAQQIVCELEDDPKPPSELADTLNTSVQNVHYHLDRLSSAGAVDVVDTAYSERGREMDVYAPTADPLVIVGSSQSGDSLKSVLSKLLGAVGFVAILSVLIQRLVSSPTDPMVQSGASYGAPPTATAPPIGAYVFIIGMTLILTAACIGHVRRSSTTS